MKWGTARSFGRKVRTCGGLVKRWRKSGPNLQKMLDADRDLIRRVEHVFRVVCP
jgi:hypothetical protein